MKPMKPPRIHSVELMQGANNGAYRYVGRMTCGHVTIWPPEQYAIRVLMFGSVTECTFCTGDREP